MNPSPPPPVSSLADRTMRRLGVRPRDVPGALVVFNGLLWVEWVAVLGACLALRPLRRLAGTAAGVRWRARLRGRPLYARIERYCLDSADRLSGARFLAPLRTRFGVEPAHLTFSLAETVVVYNVGFVAWLPLNLAAAQFYARSRSDGDGGEEGAGGSGSGSGSGSGGGSGDGGGDDGDGGDGNDGGRSAWTPGAGRTMRASGLEGAGEQAGAKDKRAGGRAVRDPDLAADLDCTWREQTDPLATNRAG